MLHSKTSSESMHARDQPLDQLEFNSEQDRPPMQELSSSIPDVCYVPFSNGYICLLSQDYAFHIRMNSGGVRAGVPPKPSVPRYPSPKPSGSLSSIAKLQQRLASKYQTSKGTKDNKKELENGEDRLPVAAV